MLLQIAQQCDRLANQYLLFRFFFDLRGFRDGNGTGV